MDDDFSLISGASLTSLCLPGVMLVASSSRTRQNTGGSFGAADGGRAMPNVLSLESLDQASSTATSLSSSIVTVGSRVLNNIAHCNRATAASSAVRGLGIVFSPRSDHGEASTPSMANMGLLSTGLVEAPPLADSFAAMSVASCRSSLSSFGLRSGGGGGGGPLASLQYSPPPSRELDALQSRDGNDVDEDVGSHTKGALLGLSPFVLPPMGPQVQVPRRRRSQQAVNGPVAANDLRWDSDHEFHCLERLCAGSARNAARAMRRV